MHDVIVVGGGPAGSTVAKAIADRDFNVLMVEKSRFPGENTVCGGGISTKISRKLRLDDYIIEKEISGHVYHFPWGRYGREIENVSVRRVNFDSFLANEAVESGAELLTRSKVFDVKKEDGKIKVFMKNTLSGKISTTQSCMIVFADGASTLARKFLNIGFKTSPNNTALGIIYELEWKNNPCTHYEFYFGAELSRWSYGWIFPKRDTINVGVGSLLSVLKRERKNIQNLMDHFIHNHPISSPKLRGKKVLRIAAGLIPLAPARRIYGPSTLIVGDAAGMVDPLSGNGLDYCIVGADMAGEIIINALQKQDYSERFLSRFQGMWENSQHFSQIRKGFIISKLLLPFTQIDKNLLGKFKSFFLSYGKKREKKQILKLLLYPLKV